jgi:hypothetical protein
MQTYRGMVCEVRVHQSRPLGVIRCLPRIRNQQT